MVKLADGTSIKLSLHSNLQNYEKYKSQIREANVSGKTNKQNSSNAVN